MEELKIAWELARAFLIGIGAITVLLIIIDIFRRGKQ